VTWAVTVDENTEVASGVRDGDARAEHQDVVAVIRDDGRQWLLWLGGVETGARDEDVAEQVDLRSTTTLTEEAVAVGYTRGR